MTLFRLLTLREAADFADWYRLGGEYVVAVARGMDLAVGDLPDRVDRATAALRAGETDLPPDLARTVVADLLADAAFAEPFCEWTPLWYELALLPWNRYAADRLRRVASRVAADSGLGHVPVPRFSRPRDVLVGGGSPLADVDGFADRFVFADAVTHLEWFVHVARESGVAVPTDLVSRARDETARHYALGESLSPEVREFQCLLFADDEWVRRIDDAYGLDSALFSVWARILTRERERLASA